uniref:Protein kinase domain-containing protein n=1 Tax=Glossina palpalis gambiensis TaxID=67801 RepID=A0A1B0BLK8_9MUSC
MALQEMIVLDTDKERKCPFTNCNESRIKTYKLNTHATETSKRLISATAKSRSLTKTFSYWKYRGILHAKPNWSLTAEENTETDRGHARYYSNNRALDNVMQPPTGIENLNKLFLTTNDDVLNDAEGENTHEIHQAPKRLTLQNTNLSRYKNEFLELGVIGVGQFGKVYQCLNRLDGCIYAIKKSIKPVVGSSFEKRALNQVWVHAMAIRAYC